MKYPKEHLDFVLQLLKSGGAGTIEKQKIFELYKLYVDPTHQSWTDTSCLSCSSSIQRMWSSLKEFVLNNQNKFTDETK